MAASLAEGSEPVWQCPNEVFEDKTHTYAIATIWQSSEYVLTYIMINLWGWHIFASAGLWSSCVGVNVSPGIVDFRWYIAPRDGLPPPPVVSLTWRIIERFVTTWQTLVRHHHRLIVTELLHSLYEWSRLTNITQKYLSTKNVWFLLNWCALSRNRVKLTSLPWHNTPYFTEGIS